MDMKEPDFLPHVIGPDRTLRRSRRILHRIHVFSLTLLIALTSSMGLLLITLGIYSEAEGVGLLALVALSIGVSFILFIMR